MTKDLSVKGELVGTYPVSKYNEFGVCIDCNGGRLDCLCNNFTEVNGQLVCTVCNKVVESK